MATPAEWLERLELRDVITELAEDLYAFKDWEIGEYSDNEGGLRCRYMTLETLAELGDNSNANQPAIATCAILLPGRREHDLTIGRGGVSNIAPRATGHP